jgi:AraC-like DNA-binding protein
VLQLVYDISGGELLAKIALEFDRDLKLRALHDAPPRISARTLARGDGWSVSDLMCTAGPGDRPFEERHSDFHVAIVAAGIFQYRSAGGRELLTPGSLLLANAAQNFECRHEHATGDRCLSFAYDPEYFGRLVADAAGSTSNPKFAVLRLPPMRALSATITRAAAGLAGATVSWEELSLQLAAQAVRLARGLPNYGSSPPMALARVARSLRTIESHSEDKLSLSDLAREARLSPYHFLRTFARLTGMTPHQYVLRARIRKAATRLLTESAKVLDIAFDCGFGDVSNFNRAFRTEFGISPRVYRRRFR